ncbi:hypothetical protein CR513_03797, partial [Mucuna pruriens]
MDTETRYKAGKMHFIQVKTFDLQSLRHWGSYMKGQWRRTFKGRYDNLLGIPEVEVQPTALSALTQYYDSLLRCFTFNDFQLAPTLEEYERLLVAKLLRVPELEIMKKKRNRNALERIQRIYLEEKATPAPEGRRLASFHRRLWTPGLWDSSIPPSRNYIDMVVVDAFLAKKDKGENTIIEVLANTDYTLNYCYEKNGKSLRCYTPLLYLWMTAHLFDNKRRTACPIEDFQSSWIKAMSKLEWTQYLEEASEKTIR